jgi:hypothetical protein
MDYNCHKVFLWSTSKSTPQNNFHNQLVWKLQTKQVNNNKQMSVEGMHAMIISDSWRFTNASISLSRVAQLDSHSQCFAFQAICTFFAYPCRAVWMIDATSSSFSIHLWISHGMFPTPQMAMPKTCNNWLEVNFTKMGSGSSGFPCVKKLTQSHSL